MRSFAHIGTRCGALALAGLLGTGVGPVAAQTGEGASTDVAPPALDLLPDSSPRREDREASLLGDVVSPLLGDFRRLSSQTTLMMLGTGGAMALAAHPADVGTSRLMSGEGTLDRVFEVGETLGGARVQFFGAAATYLAGRASGTRRVSVLGADLLRAQIIAQTLTITTKLSVRRERPDATMFSFPSGHSSVSFASATVLQEHFGWNVGIPAYAVATYVAASRVQEKRHFLSDVVFGAAVGLVAGHALAIDRGDYRFALAPSVGTSGGGGIGITLTKTR